MSVIAVDVTAVTPHSGLLIAVIDWKYRSVFQHRAFKLTRSQSTELCDSQLVSRITQAAKMLLISRNRPHIHHHLGLSRYHISV